MSIQRGFLFCSLAIGLSLVTVGPAQSAANLVGFIQTVQDDELLKQLDNPEHLRLMVIFLVIFALLSVFGLLYVINTNKILQSNNKLILQQKNKITDQKDALAFQNESLEELNIEKNNMLSVVAHDLKVPLGNIQGLVGLIYLEKDNLTEQQVEYLDLIKKVSTDGVSLVDNMLNVHKIEAELQQMTMAQHSLTQIVESVVKTHTASAEVKQIDITTKGKESEITVETDKQYFHQIISNLLSNAIKYSQNGSLIEVLIEETDNTARVTVKDEGPGMSPGDQKRIFAGYQKISSEDGEKDKTTGFGLAIVSKLVEKLQAKINVDSVQGEGTSIGVEIQKRTST